MCLMDSALMMLLNQIELVNSIISKSCGLGRVGNVLL